MPDPSGDACLGFADLLDALAHGELAGAAAADLHRHIAGCPDCAAAFAATAGLRAGLATLREERAPESLRRRLEQAVAAEPRETAVAAELREQPAEGPPAPSVAIPPRPRRRQALSLIAAGVAGLAIGLGVAAPWPGAGRALVAHDLVAGHARALLAEAPPQIAAGDPHRVRPWLSARLPVAPGVEPPPGFVLLGARLDLVAGQPAAAILYRRREHAITVFATAREAATDWPDAPATRRGFGLVPWQAGGVSYVAVSDLNLAELSDFAARLGATTR